MGTHDMTPAGIVRIRPDGGQDDADAIERFQRQIDAKQPEQFFVFLSHRQPDSELAREIKLQLERLAPEKLLVWYAESDIRKGSRWFDAIRQALHSADLFLLVYTAEEWRWDWCNWEAGLFDKAESKEEPIVVLRSRGLNLPDPLTGYQGLEATEDAISEFLEDFLLGHKYVAARPSVAPLSTKSRDEIRAVSKQIEQLMSIELRSGYIPHQMTVRWEPVDELTEVPGDATVEADEATRVLFRIRVTDETLVTWDELTAFHRSGDHVHVDDFSGRWIEQIDDAVGKLNKRQNPEPLSWRFRAHQRMILYRPYLYKYERRDGRLTSISILLLEEDSPRKVGGYRYNMLRSCERTHTEIIEQLRDDRTSLVDADLDDDDWRERRGQLHESVLMVQNEERTIQPFDDLCCQLVFGEDYRKQHVGAVLDERASAIGDITAELIKSRDDYDQVALAGSVDRLADALAMLWPEIAQAYLAAVHRLDVGTT